MVDDRKIALNPAVELSYLSHEQQTDLLDLMEAYDSTPSLAQAQRLKQAAKEGILDKNGIDLVMREEKPNQKEVFKLPRERLAKYFTPDTPLHKMEETIVKEDGFCPKCGIGANLPTKNFIEVLTKYQCLTMEQYISLCKHPMSEVRDIARQELKRIWMTDPKKLKTVIIDFEERAYDKVVFALILQLPSDVTSVYKQDLQRLGMETNDKMPVAAMDRVKMKMSAQILLFHRKLTIHFLLVNPSMTLYFLRKHYQLFSLYLSHSLPNFEFFP